MILGIGTDIVDERRIGKSVDRFGDRFLARIYTDAERDEAARRKPESRGRDAPPAEMTFE